MKNYYIIFLLLTFCATNVCAQHNPGLEISPSGLRFNNIHESCNSKNNARFEQTACYFTIKKQQNADTSETSCADVSVFGSAGELDGDFLVYQGNKSTDLGVAGSGVKDYGKFGMLYGKAFYASGKHSGISWNAMRYPELYLPYIITDSTGGDSKFETYCAQGGYAKKIGKMHYGFNFDFYGEQAYRLSDPRVLNNVTFLTFKLSAGRVFNDGNALIVSGYYMRNKQYLHNRYWRPGEQQRFFVIYGFGLYDNKESSVSFGVSRMYYINNCGAEITLLPSEKKAFAIMASVNYDYKKMYTEESDIVQLYNSQTHNINPSVSIRYKTNKWNLALHSRSEILMRKGIENVLERYMTDQANSTYDYRKIAEEQNYKYKFHTSQNVVAAEYDINPYQKIGIECGATFTLRTEKNTKYGYFVKNQNIMPSAKFDYNFQSKNGKNSFEIGAVCARQIAMENSYDVEIKNNAIPHVDFQTCFAPYAYFAAEYDAYTAQFCYKYNFAKYSIGLKISGLIISGNRIDGTSYTKEIGYNSVCPMIDPTSAKHDEKWIDASIFITF